jgi:hypothetical protein
MDSYLIKVDLKVKQLTDKAAAEADTSQADMHVLATASSVISCKAGSWHVSAQKRIQKQVPSG